MTFLIELEEWPTGKEWAMRKTLNFQEAVNSDLYFGYYSMNLIKSEKKKVSVGVIQRWSLIHSFNKKDPNAKKVRELKHN